MNEADSHPRTTYSERLDIRRAEWAGSERRLRFHSYLQVATLAGAVVVVVPALNHVFSIAWEVVPAVVFLTLFVSRDRLRRHSEMYLRAVRYFERGLARLDGHWAGGGESGIRHLDPLHPNAQDLDLFGKGSPFELLCNARTPMGQDTLAKWLLEPAPPDKIRERQEAVAELADRVDLREDIAIVAENARAGVHTEALYAWGEREPLLVASPFRIVAWGLSVFGATAVIAFVAYFLAQFGIFQLPEKTLAELEVYFISIALIYSVVLLRFKKRTDRIIHEIEKAGSDLSLIAEVLLRLEAEPFASPRLVALRGELDAEGQSPSRRIARLNRLMELVDSRRNGVVRFIGMLLLWDLHLAYSIEGWRGISGPVLRGWLNAVGEIEALSSLAGYCYEHPSDVFPEFTAESPCLNAIGIGHPLLDERHLSAMTCGSTPVCVCSL